MVGSAWLDTMCRVQEHKPALLRVLPDKQSRKWALVILRSRVEGS